MIKRYFNSSSFRFSVNSRLGFYRYMPDSSYLKKEYYSRFQRKLSLTDPKSFNEKIQWLKLYDRKPIYSTMVDKYVAKQYVAKIIGEEHIIPTLGVWDRFDDIDFDSLPDRFVLKCTHDSGGMVICKDKSSFDKKAARKRIKKCLKRNYYWAGREWPYKNVPRKIIAEKLLQGESGEEVKDYKVWCFNGIAKCTMVCRGRFSEEGLHNTFYDREWNVMLVKRPSHPIAEIPDEKPINYEKMIEIAEELSQRIPFLRVDFYEVGGKLYFGELTFYPAAGFEGFEPEEWDYTFGEWLQLPVDC